MRAHLCYRGTLLIRSRGLQRCLAHKQQRVAWCARACFFTCCEPLSGTTGCDALFGTTGWEAVSGWGLGDTWVPRAYETTPSPRTTIGP